MTLKFILAQTGGQRLENLFQINFFENTSFKEEVEYYYNLV